MNVEDRLATMGRRVRGNGSVTEAEWHGFLREQAHPSLRRRRLVTAVTVAAALGIAMVGGRAFVATMADPPSARLGPAASGERDAFEPVQVWFVRGNELYLTHQRTNAGVEVSEETGGTVDNVALVTDALHRLLEGVPRPVAESSRPPVTSALPPGTRVLNLSMAPGATVDLSEFSSGLSDERLELAIGQIASTLLQLGSLDSVSISEEGRLLTPAPVTRARVEELLPPIVVTAPVFVDRPQSFVGYVPLAGSASVFEATVSYELVDERGEVLEKGFTTATCGTGCRGSYRARVRFEVRQPTAAILNVYESSAEDGSRLWEVTVPVHLCPAGEAVSRSIRLEPDQQQPCGGP